MPRMKIPGSNGKLIETICSIILLISFQNSFILSHSHIQWIKVPFAMLHLKQVSGMLLYILFNCIGVIYRYIKKKILNIMKSHWTSFWYLWQFGQVPSPAGKLNQHLHKACQQKEAWSALKCPGRCCVDCGLQKTQWTNTSRWQMKCKIDFHLKRGLWTT